MLGTDEIWKPVVGQEHDYEVSDHGRIRSLTREKTYARRDQYSGRDLRIVRKHRGCILRPARMACGHLSVVLGRGRGSVLVHRIVLEAFVGPCPDGMEALHRDGVPNNNRLTNLRWGTRSENISDAIHHAAMPRGETKWNAKLRDEDIPTIRALIGTRSAASIAREYGVSEASIRQVRDRRCWKHVKENAHAY